MLNTQFDAAPYPTRTSEEAFHLPPFSMDRTVSGY